MSPVTELYRVLPAVSQSYYQWFEGMQLLWPGEEPSHDWLGFPCVYNGLSEFVISARAASLPAAAVKAL